IMRTLRYDVRVRAALVVLIVASTAFAADKPRWETVSMPPAMPAASATGMVEVDGAQIYYARYGAGDPVVLLHGGLGNGDHWANQVPTLTDAKHEVIIIDSRGQGRSTHTAKAPSYDQMASDTLAVLDALKIGKAAFVGWSDGGEIALKIAIAHPDRVAKLFVFGSNYNSEGSKKRNGPSPTFSAYSVKCKADYQRMSKTPKQFDQLVDWLLPVWRNPMGFSKEQLKTITAPTMVADGDHDEVIVLSQVEEMSHLIPNAQLKVFEGASHFALWQDPADFNKTLVDFLAP
ncbi:MAG TPA: alpha/beta hydrolase, partial [Kofleriaceae bacterium]